MPLDAIAGLVTAVFELKAVQVVTRAINANLPKDGPLGTIRPSSAQLNARPRKFYSPTPQERPIPRPVPPASPAFAPRADRYDPCDRDRPVPAEQSVPWRMEGPDGKQHPGPIDPPWKHLPPAASLAPEIRVNLVRPKVDLIVRGGLVDLFA